MHADPLFLDLRIALGNAEPIRTILLEHLAEGAGGNSSALPSQRALLDAGLAQMIQSIYVAAEDMLLKIAASTRCEYQERRVHQVRRQRHACHTHQLHQRAGTAGRQAGHGHRAGAQRHRQRTS